MSDMLERFSEFFHRLSIGAPYHAFECHLFGQWLIDIAEESA